VKSIGLNSSSSFNQLGLRIFGARSKAFGAVCFGADFAGFDAEAGEEG
jgi:hypothetical protein